MYYVDPFKERALLQVFAHNDTLFIETSPETILTSLRKIAKIAKTEETITHYGSEKENKMSFNEYFYHTTGVSLMRFNLLRNNPQVGPISDVLKSTYFNLQGHFQTQYNAVESKYNDMIGCKQYGEALDAFINGDDSKAQVVFECLSEQYCFIRANKLTKLL